MASLLRYFSHIKSTSSSSILINNLHSTYSIKNSSSRSSSSIALGSLYSFNSYVTTSIQQNQLNFKLDKNNSNSSNNNKDKIIFGNELSSVKKTIPIVLKRSSSKRFGNDVHKRISFHSSTAIIQSYQDRIKLNKSTWREMQIDYLNEKEYNRPIADTLYSNRINLYDQQYQQPQHQQQVEEKQPINNNNNNSSTVQQKDNIKNLTLLFGRDILEESNLLDNDNNTKTPKELKINSTVEFLDNDKVKIGVITGSTTRDVIVSYLDIGEDSSKPKFVTNYKIPKRSVIGSFPLDEINITPQDLLNFEKKYKTKFESLPAIYKNLNDVTDIFRNPMYKFSTYEAAKIFFGRVDPTPLDCYVTHRILSSDPNFTVDHVRGGYRVVEQTIDLIDDFIQRLKLFVTSKTATAAASVKKNSSTQLLSKSQQLQQQQLKSVENLSFFEHFKYSDYQYINLLRLYLHYPEEKHYPFRQFLQLIMASLDVPLSHRNVRALLLQMGFLIAGVERDELNLFTKETMECVKRSRLESISDPLASIRRTLELPAFAIDSNNIVGAEDAFSFDFNESNQDQIVFYIHTLDVARWIRPHDQLFKNAMLTQSTHYFANSSYPMLPIDFVKSISFNLTSKQVFAISQKFIVRRDNCEIISTEVIPTKLTNIAQLSFQQANKLISNVGEMDESSMSEGHLILKELTYMANTRSTNMDLNIFGRRIRKKRLINQKTGEIKNIDHQSIESAHILNTLLTFADDGYTSFFKMNKIPAFFKSGHNYRMFPLGKSVAMATTPLLLQVHQIKLIENDLLDKLAAQQQHPMIQSANQGNRPKLLKSRMPFASKSAGVALGGGGVNTTNTDYIGELQGEIKMISNTDRVVNIYFKDYDYQQNGIHIDQVRLQHFKVGDIIKMKVKGFDYNKIELILECHSNSFECSDHKRILEALCYECNKLLCFRCSTNHNKQIEHSNFIDHIDDIRIELGQILHNINNNNDKSNNENDNNTKDNDNNNKDNDTTSTNYSIHISKRLDDIWNMMKCKTENYNSLSSDEKQISKHFEELHKYLMIEEQKLKKPIIDHKELIINQIDHNIKELKHLINIIILNNHLETNSKNNDLETNSATTSSSSFHDDTTESYSIPFIMKSINSSESLSTFIKSNNEMLFCNTTSTNEHPLDILINYNNNSDSMILDLIYKYNNQFKSSSFKNNDNNNDNDNKTNNRKLELKQFDFTKLDHLLKQSIRPSSNSTTLNNNHNKHTYILSTHQNGASLIDLSNSNITDLGTIKDFDTYFIISILAGEYIYMFGGSDDLGKYIRYSIADQSFQVIQDQVLNSSLTVSVCYDGKDHIYLYEVGVFGSKKIRIIRFNVRTLQFELFCEEVDDGASPIIFCHYNGFLYILPTYSFAMTIIDIKDKTTTKWQSGQKFKWMSACTDHKGNIYLHSNDDKFIRFNIQTKEIKYLNHCNITANRSLPMIYHEISEVESYFYITGGVCGSARYSIEKDQWESILSDDKLKRYSSTLFLK
ncbi:hypothetical protein PPL_06702 [Heterostelium album PN500]|uniref:B box-type domain-containing protein n=1 Tax=Heterostelium pallidum (strain ATCC 26659 / Pp 5 / PN500) TaxID=670386 RepID=D3BFG8_HETP5|nr:hypothetical protein PPL_06702 [Heterostelium album PN500]EFA79882.1 hypothetical protein PPL_06702 [Heterostelium album PN500]|eukprot:XP_020432003.1 hypothetical protein PPL_06702 [Heterostelium album PN500]